MVDIPKKVCVDTNVLLDGLNVEDFEHVLVPIVVVEELDKLKRSQDSDLSYRARKANKMLENADNVEVLFVSDFALPKYLDNSVNDNKIIGFAKDVVTSRDGHVFLSNDLNVRLKARNLGIECRGFQTAETCDVYTGSTIIKMNENELANWYENEYKANIFDLNINEYLLIENGEGKLVDSWVWTKKGFRHVATKRVNSNMFGKLEMKDEYQLCAIDNMFHNSMCMVKGKPGSGKSYLCLSYALSQIEKSKYDKLVIFSNPVPSRNSATLGFYPGTRFEKLSESSIGNMLISKLGDKTTLEQLVHTGKLDLLPFCDIRGYDTTGMKAIVYIPEAQNLDIELMKIAIQRVGDDCQILIDGDYNAQVDCKAFEGKNNGMRRVSEIFRGQDFYGEIELPKIYRSKYAEVADRL